MHVELFEDERVSQTVASRTVVDHIVDVRGLDFGLAVAVQSPDIERHVHDDQSQHEVHRLAGQVLVHEHVHEPNT